jgi:hypothetical protein
VTEFLPVGVFFTLGIFLKITEVAQIYGLSHVFISAKMGWGTFWATFSQTLLLTLYVTCEVIGHALKN